MKFRVHMTVTEEREYVVEATSPGAAENMVETELDSIRFKVTDRDVSYVAAYRIPDEKTQDL